MVKVRTILFGLWIIFLKNISFFTYGKLFVTIFDTLYNIRIEITN